MNYLINGIKEALHLLLTGDPSTYSAIWKSVQTSSSSIFLSLAIGLPLGFKLGYENFWGKKIISVIVNTLLSLPTVVIGLLVYTWICRQGLFGNLNLLFSIKAIVIGQTILALPIVIALTSNTIENIDKNLILTLLTLGANKYQATRTILYESRYAILMIIAVVYGRVISELGISMMLGGNIKWYTRTITTAIAFETSEGDFALGVALGIVLLAIALLVNSIIIIMRKKCVKP